MNPNLSFSISSFAIALASAVFVIPLIIRQVRNLGALAKPNERSSHLLPTPTFGGLSFMPGLMISVLWFTTSMDSYFILGACLFMCLLGFLDDLHDLNALLKLAGQIGAASAMYAVGFRLDSLHGFLGIYELADGISFTLTFLFIVALVNAVNLVDGVDGLAGGVGLVSTLVFAGIFFINGDKSLLVLACAFAGALVGFLWFNVQSASIFMGDTGSLVQGLILSLFFLRIWSYGNTTFCLIATAAVLFPCIDMIRLFVVRIKSRKSPFKADKNHFHHLLLKAGFNHQSIALIGCMITLLFVGVGYFLAMLFPLTLALLLLVGAGSMMYGTFEIVAMAKQRSRQKTLFVK